MIVNNIRRSDHSIHLPPVEIGFLILLLLPAKRLLALGELFDNLTLTLCIYASLLLAAVLLLSAAVKSFREMFGSFHWGYLVSGALWGLGLYALGASGYAINRSALGMQLPTEAQLFALNGTDALFLGGVIFIGPILEEYVFRGLLLRFLLSKTPVYAAIVVSAGLFSIYHLSVFQLLPTFLWGVGFALLAYRAKTLWPVIIAHILINGMGFALFFLYAR